MNGYNKQLANFLAEVVLTSHYLSEPARKSSYLLHDAEMKCLKIIHTFQPIQIHLIAQYMSSSKARATQLVHSLEGKNLVERTCPPEDHRTQLISTTEQGKQAVIDLRQKYHHLAERIEQKIGTNKTKLLCEILEEITPLNEQVETQRRIA